MGRSSLLVVAAAAARAACVPARLRAADPLDCVPPSAQTVIVSDSPRKLAEAVTGLAALQKAQKLPQYRAIYDSAAAKRAFQMLALFEKELGAKWPNCSTNSRAMARRSASSSRATRPPRSSFFKAKTKNR